MKQQRASPNQKPGNNRSMAANNAEIDPNETEEMIFLEESFRRTNIGRYLNVDILLTGENSEPDRSAPEPVKDFSDARLHKSVMDNIGRLKYSTPTPVQQGAIPVILEGRNVMACAQTGSGKTGAYLIPMISKLLTHPGSLEPTLEITPEQWFPLALILSPTRELAVQIFNEARKFSFGTGLKCAVIHGEMDVDQKDEHHGSLAKGCHILVATPGKLIQLLEGELVNFQHILYLVLDEADRLLRKDFRPVVQKIIDNREMPRKEKRCTLMFSATFAVDIQKVAFYKIMGDYLFVKIGRICGVCENIEQKILDTVGWDDKDEHLKEILNIEGVDKRKTLIFLEKRNDVEDLYLYLKDRKYPVARIHADLTQKMRVKALKKFEAGDLHILLATGVAARGLDFKDVMHVINYDLPGFDDQSRQLTKVERISEYIHRIGRTGRNENDKDCVATSFFVAGRDDTLATGLRYLLGGVHQVVPDFLLKIDERSKDAADSSDGRQFTDQRHLFQSIDGKMKTNNKRSKRVSRR